jgi:hypothetical protein
MTTTEKLIRSIEAIYRRLDSQTGDYGRNVTATFRTLGARWDQLADALEADGFEELDARPTLAARYARIERRRAFGPAR